MSKLQHQDETGNVDLKNKKIKNPQIETYRESVVDSGSLGSTYNIDLNSSNIFSATLTENCTISFSNWPTSGIAGNITLIVQQNATGGYTITWPSEVKWPDGEEPTMDTSANAYTIYTF